MQLHHTPSALIERIDALVTPGAPGWKIGALSRVCELLNASTIHAGGRDETAWELAVDGHV